MPQLPSDYTQTEAREFNPETNSGIKLIQGANNKKKGSETIRKQNAFFGKSAYMSYPIARGMQEKTGDTMRIKCVQYIPPSDGDPTFGLSVINPQINVNRKGRGFALETNTKELRQDLEYSGQGVYEAPKLQAKFTDANTRMRNNTVVKYRIELPMPQEVNDSNQVTWGDDRLNALELAGLAVAQNLIEKGPIEGVQESQKAIRALVSGVDLGSTFNNDTQNAIRAALSGAAVGALGSNVSAQSVIARSSGQILNSNLELLFQGMNLRSFPYSITFSPRSSKESQVVKAIIRSLKQSMAPKAGEYNGGAQGIFLKSPDVFQIEYLRDGHPHPFLNRLKLTALTGMNVNYTNSGTYTSYEDGTPVNLRMDLTFKEINPIYHEDYLKGNSGDGYDNVGVGY